MPERKTAVNACAVIIKIQNELGQMVDISGSANEATIKLERDLGDYVVFNDKNTYYIECKEDATVDLTCIYTQKQNEGADILKRWWTMGGPRTIQIFIPQGTKGYDQWQGEAICESQEYPLKADDAKPIMIKTSLKMDGGIRADLVSGAA